MPLIPNARLFNRASFFFLKGYYPHPARLSKVALRVLYYLCS